VTGVQTCALPISPPPPPPPPAEGTREIIQPASPPSLAHVDALSTVAGRSGEEQPRTGRSAATKTGKKRTVRTGFMVVAEAYIHTF
jgi:hypothetical protein